MTRYVTVRASGACGRSVGVRPPVAAYRAPGSVARDRCVARRGLRVGAPAEQRDARCRRTARRRARRPARAALRRRSCPTTRGPESSDSGGYRGPIGSGRSGRDRLAPMRLLVARCSVTYEGRLGARLAPGDPPHPVQGRRLDRGPLRRQGVQAAQLDEPAVHDRGARRHDRRAQRRRARRCASSCTRSLHDTTIELGDDPGLEKDGVEAELQQLHRGARRRAARRLHARAARVPDRHRPDRPAVPRRRRPRGRRRGEARRRDRRRRPAAALPGAPRPRPAVRADRRHVRRAADQAAGQGLRREQGRRLRRDRPRRACAATSTPTSSSSEPRPSRSNCVRAVLLLQCPDRPGIVAAVGAFVADAGGNIVEADQHSDPAAGLFLQRVEFDVDATRADARATRSRRSRSASRWTGTCTTSATRPRVAVLVSRQGHCLGDLLVRVRARRAPGRGRARRVEPRHARATSSARFGVPFHALPVRDDDRDAQERALGALLDEHRARRRRARALHARAAARGSSSAWRERMINIHHSFLPSFAGARPYAQAHERGVKVIGATAHYVTPELDEGPDHRPAGDAGLAPRRSRRASSAAAATSKRSCSPKRCACTSSTA